MTGERSVLDETRASERKNERFVRWQEFRINQLTLCISLFLTFSVATLGFSLNILIQPQWVVANCVAKLAFCLTLLGGIASIGLGAVACLTRLEDFRATAQVARHDKNPSKADYVEEQRARSKSMEKWTWRLFYWQLIGFGVQVITLAVALAISYASRLL